MIYYVLKVLELEGILHATTALLESLELLQLQQVCECLWYSGHAGPRRMVRTRLYERGNRGSAILRTGFPKFCGSAFPPFPWHYVSSCLDHVLVPSAWPMHLRIFYLRRSRMRALTETTRPNESGMWGRVKRHVLMLDESCGLCGLRLERISHGLQLSVYQRRYDRYQLYVFKLFLNCNQNYCLFDIIWDCLHYILGQIVFSLYNVFTSERGEWAVPREVSISIKFCNWRIYNKN